MDTIGNPSLFIYSAHDTNVDNMLVWLTQDHTSFDYVPFASQVTFELQFSAKCIQKSSKNRLSANESETGGEEECFGVQILYNGMPMRFAERCPNGSGFSTEAQKTGCTYTEFKQFMQAIWYKGLDVQTGNLDLACYDI